MANLDTTFVIATGSVTGKDHYHARQNRQDGCWVERSQLRPSSSGPSALAAIVCDGCGDPGSPCSEVGAALGSRLLAHGLCELAAAGLPAEEALERARLDLLAHLGALAAGMGEMEDAVRRYFLFTALGTLITETEAVFFSIGDGLFAANDRLVTVGPYPDNTPPYVAYALIPFHSCAGANRFTIHLRLPTPELDRFMLGTDGTAPLLDGSLTMPGKQEAACGRDQWWAEDLYYTNPAALTNRLRLLAADSQRIDWEARRRVTVWGRLQDDATLVLGRRTIRKDAADGDA
jgi:Protein phosphatase 2C